jgi:four helix bundle protein
MIETLVKGKGPILDHEKLDVYHIAIEFVILSDAIIEHIPRGRGYLSDQLQRAALSISLNIAEGAGEYAIDEKVRFYRMAKRSATECAGILDVCQKLQLLDEQKYIKGRDLIVRIVSILVKMALAEKLIGKGQAEARARAEARDCSFERSLMKEKMLNFY